MNDKNLTKNFNMQNYRFEVTLLPYNEDPVALNPDVVVHLVLEDDLFRWYRKGFIVFQNGYEMFERSLNPQKAAGVVDASTLRDGNNDGYVFRNDGKDRINIKIKPIISEGTESNLQEPPDSTWLIDFTGNIYDFEEPMVSDLSSKVKKIYFWDEAFQKMLERDLVWSTATSILNENKQSSSYDPKIASDDNRKMYTGTAIKDILENVMKFEVDSENFDIGATKIFHTAPNESNVWQNIMYLLDNHYASISLKSKNNDVCIFLYDETKKFKLMPLTKIFEKAGKDKDNPKEYQIEHLLLEDYGTLTPEADRVWMAPILEQYNDSIDVKITKLRKYSFTDMAGIDSVRDMVTTAVHTYDRRNKTFTRAVANSIIENIPENLKTDYIEPFFLSKSYETLINMNNVKKENQKVKSLHTPIASKTSVERMGHGGLILKSIFLNLCLSVEMDGSTNRKVARFIGVDRMSNNDNEFDYKLGGQWFIVKVKHNFFRNTYANELVCVKPHIFNKIPVEENID